MGVTRLRSPATGATTSRAGRPDGSLLFVEMKGRTRGAETFARQFPQLAALKLGKNRVHLDLVVDDLDQSTAEIEKLGGRWLEPGNTRELEGSGGGAWPTPRATNSTSTSSPARRADIRTRLRPAL